MNASIGEMMTLQRLNLKPFLWAAILGVLFCVPAVADISRFVGNYVGSAEVQEANGTSVPRDMSVTITEGRKGFTVDWTSTTYRSDGRVSEKSYSIEFLPSARDGVFAAAMQRNVFGHEVPLDPMKGEPYVWARINDDMLSVFSLYVAEDGGYEIQQFDRSLSEQGLHLEFSRVRNGELQRTVTSELIKQ